MKKTSSAVPRVYHLTDPDERVPVSNLFQVFHELLGVVCFPTDLVLGTTLNGNIIYIYMLFADREVRIGNNCARGLDLKTEGTVFPNMGRPRPANSVFIFSSVEYFVSSFCVEFSLQPFSTRAFDI